MAAWLRWASLGADAALWIRLSIGNDVGVQAWIDPAGVEVEVSRLVDAELKDCGGPVISVRRYHVP
ncbi:MAG: hypothetical protein IT449_08535 [Phycisphaerales bacterium]|nr:hypothetical protein [Phycisphaerales bacterium]